MQAVIGALRAVLGLDTSAFEKGIGQAQKELNAMSRDFQKTARELDKMGKAMTAALTAPITLMGTLTLRAAGNFEEGMNKVKAATGASAEQMKLLADQAKILGKSAGFTATETASAMESLAKNGLDVTQILGGATDAVVKLAAANGAQLDPAANIVTDTMQNFKKTASELGGVVDQVTGTLLASKFGFEDYRLAIGQAAGVAGKVGITFEDFNAGLAATSSSFASGSDAGTSFKTFLTKLVPTSKEASDAMKLLNLEFFDAKGAMLPLDQVAERLKKSLGGLSDKSRTEFASKMFGTDSMRTALALMEQGAAGIQKMRAEIAKASSTDQAAVRIQGLNGALRQFKAAFEGLNIAIGESGLLAWATQAVMKATELTAAMSKLNPELLKMATIAAGVVAAVGPLLLLFSGLTSAVIKVGTVAARLAPAFAPLIASAMPLLRFAGIVGLIAVAVAAFGDQLDVSGGQGIKLIDVVNVLISRGAELARQAGVVTAALVKWAEQNQILAAAIKYVKDNASGFEEALSPLGLVKLWAKATDFIMNVTTALIKSVIAAFSVLPSVLGELMQLAVMALVNGIAAVLNPAIEAINARLAKLGVDPLPLLPIVQWTNANTGAMDRAGQTIADAWNKGFINNFFTKAIQDLAAESLREGMNRMIGLAPVPPPVGPGDFGKKAPPPGGGTGGRNLSLPTDADKSLAQTLKRIEEETKSLEKAKAFLKTSGETSEKLLFQAADEMERIGKKVSEMLKGLDPDSEVAKRIVAVVTALEKMRTATDNVGQAIRTAFEIERSWGDGQIAHAETMRLLKEAMDTGRLSQAAYAAAVKEANEALVDQGFKARGAAGGFDAFVAGIESAAEETRRANNAFNSGKRVFGEFESAVKEISNTFFDLDADIGTVLASIAKRFAQLAFELLVLRPIFEEMARVVKDATTGSSSSGGGGWLSGIVSGVVGMFTGGSGGGDGGATGPGTGYTYAEGGQPPTGTPYWVGERGKELKIDAGGGSTIIPHDASMRIASWYENASKGAGMDGARAAVHESQIGSVDNSKTENNFHITTGVQQTVRAEIQSLMPMITRAASNQVVRDRKRGGPMKNAFRAG